MAVKRTYVRQQRPVPISPDQAEKRKADIEEKREYIEKLKSGGQMADGTTAMKAENIDVAALEKQLARDERALEYLAPKEGNAAQKRQAQKDFDEAKAYISEHSLTLAEVGKYPNHEGYDRAVEKSISSEVGNPKFQAMCQQLKRAASILDPSDPELRNVNRYRQEK